MIPRLRSMVVDEHSRILVLDRCGASADAGHGPLNQAAKAMGLAGGMVFANEVSLGDDDLEEGLTLYADEVDALRWAVAALEETAFAEDLGPRLNALRLLIQRAEQ